MTNKIVQINISDKMEKSSQVFVFFHYYHMFNHSTQVSREITDHILAKAKKRHMENIKDIALSEAALTISGKYPEQCSTNLMNFYNITSSRSERLTFPLKEPPQSPSQYHHFIHTPFPTSSKLTRGRSSKFSLRKGRGSHNPPSNAKIQCIKLELEDYDDKEIEVLRQKKQRYYDLEAIFIQSESIEKAKPRIQRNKQTFTTDFNGQGLELNTIKKKPLTDSYFRAEVNVGIREEREENQRLPTEDSGMARSKKENRVSYKYAPLKSKRLLAKQSIPSEVNISYTIKDLQQQLMKRQLKKMSKGKKSQDVPWKMFNLVGEI